jgi:hypothetical protein
MFGMAFWAEHRQARAIRRIVRKVNHVEPPVRLVAHLADVAGRFQHGQAEPTPPRIVILPVFGSNGQLGPLSVIVLKHQRLSSQ